MAIEPSYCSDSRCNGKLTGEEHCKSGEAWLLAFFFVLQKMTAWVMVSVSYRSQRVSNFHSSFSTATKNCLMPCASDGVLCQPQQPHCHRLLDALFRTRLDFRDSKKSPDVNHGVSQDS